MDFGPCFKVHNLVSVYPKGMKLVQMTNLDVVFHVVVSVYRLVTISNSPQFPVEFRNGLLFVMHLVVTVARDDTSELVRASIVNRVEWL